MKKLAFLFILSQSVFADSLTERTEVINPIYTTVNRTIVPRNIPSENEVAIDDPENFTKNGFGLWDYGPGVPYVKHTDLMSASYDSSAVSQSTKLLRFFTMTDVHITDEESPAQPIYLMNEPLLRGNRVSVYAPLMLYSTQVLDAAIRTINKLHKEKTIDFGLVLGDVINSAQYNEIRWFIDIMDGQIVNPDSGSDDDPIAGPNNDHQDEFDAEGLNSDIPWYAAIGNHDHFWLGAKTFNAKLKTTMVGEKILQTGNIIRDPNAMNMNTYSNGVMDGSTVYGTIIGSGVVADMEVIPTVPADPNRRAMTTVDIINEYSNSTTLPDGHGFKQDNSGNVFKGSYSFEPKSNLPIKVIMLDNTMDNKHGVPPGGIYGFGMLDNGRYEWLMKQLRSGQDENKLMIIAAHVPIGVAHGTKVGWLPAAGYKSEADLINQLQEFSNLILWVSGHRHLNQIKAFPSTDISHLENSFWQVETKSLREFPQQFRTIDIVSNSDNTLSIIATNVDPEVAQGSFADISRSYAIASSQIYGLMTPPAGSGPSINNAELIVPLSRKMQTIIRGLGDP